MAKFAAKDSNKNITLSPHGTGKVVVGTGATDATVQSDGNHNLVLQTGNATTGSISITDGADGNIAITPNGTGEVDISKVDIDGGAIDAVTLGTNSAITEAQIDNININGNAIISSNTDGNIDLTPNGTGEVNISKVDIDSGAIDGVTIGTNSAVTDLRVDNIKIDGNNIVSTDTDGNINLTPNGTGEVNISKVDIDSGTMDDVDVNMTTAVLTTTTAQKQAIVDGGGTSEAKGLVPVGAIFQMAFTPGSTWLSTNRYLICDGSSLNSSTDTQYADLYSAIGTTWGGSSASAFNIPDLKGAYLRGVGTSTVFTANSTITLAQTLSDQFQGHQHEQRVDRGSPTGAGGSSNICGLDSQNSSPGTQNSQSVVAGIAGAPRTGTETRPNSRGVQFIIKY